MSESQLSINLAARDSASAQIKGLETTIKTLGNEVANLSAIAGKSSEFVSAQLAKEINVRQEQIAKVREQIVVLQQEAAQAAATAQAIAALSNSTVRFGSTLEGINEAFGLNDRSMKSASESARTLSTSLNAAADADAKLRDETLATTAALEREQAVARQGILNVLQKRVQSAPPPQPVGQTQREIDQSRIVTSVPAAGFGRMAAELAGVKTNLLDATASAKAFEALGFSSAEAVRAEAEYENRVRDAINGKARAEAQYENSVRDAVAVRTRQEAEYENRNIDAVAARSRAEAEYENRVREAQAVRQRQMAEYENAQLDAIAVRTRAEAEYENAQRTAVARQQRQMAEYENAQRDAEAKKASRSGRGIVAAASPQSAAADAAAKATLAGAGSTEAAMAGTAAAIAAKERQVVAIKAVEAAEMAAARAGAEASEIAAAGARAATLALNSQAAAGMRVAGAARAGAGGSAVLNTELKHGVAIFDELARGQRGALFGTLGAAARDAGVGAGMMATSVGALAGVMATLTIARHVEELGKWATQVRASASAVGMSVPQYSALQGALTSMGLKADEADASLRHMATNLSTALSDPASKAAQAFRNLGISEAELERNGTNVSGMLRMLSDAFVRTQDDANKSANFVEILGRSYEHLLPFLQNGSKGIDEFTEKAKENGRVITEDEAKALEQLGEKVRGVGEAITSGAIPAFLAWKGPIEGIAEALRGLIGLASQVIAELGQIVSMPIGAITDKISAASKEAKEKGGPSFGEFVKGGIGSMLPNMGLFDKLGQFGKWIGTEQPGAKTAQPDAGEFGNVPATKTAVPALGRGETPGALDKMRAEAAEAKRIAVESSSTVREAHESGTAAEVGVMQRTLQNAKLNATQRLMIERELNDKLATLHNEQLSNAAQGQAGPLATMRMEAAKAAEQASRGASSAKAAREAEAKAEIDVMQRTLASAKLNNLQRTELEAELANKQKSLRNQELSGGGGAAKQATRDFIAEGKLQIAEADGNAQKIAEIYDRMLAGLVSSHQATAAQIASIEREKVIAVNKANLESIREGGRQEIQQSREHRLDTELGQMAQGKFRYQGQPEQGPSADIERSKTAVQEAEMTRSRAAQEIAALQQIRDASDEGSKTRRQAEAEILSVTVAAKQQEVALYKEAGAAAVEAAKKTMAPFQQLFDGLGSHIEEFASAAVKSLIAPQQELIKRGLTTVKVSDGNTQLRQAASQLLNSIVNDFGKSLQQALGHVIANALSGGAANTIGELLSQTFSKILSSVTGSAAGSALGSVAGSAAGDTVGTAAITTAVTTSSLTNSTAVTGALAVLGADLTTAIVTSTTAIVGAIGAEDVSLNLELLALNAKPSILGTTYAHGGIVPSAAGGMMVGGNGASLAILHAREMVLPAPISQGIQQMIARGSPGGNGPNNNASLNYSPTINTGSRGRGGTGMSRGEFSQMLSSHSGAMFGEARNMIKSGWRPS